MSNRFDYVAYDAKAMTDQCTFKVICLASHWQILKTPDRMG